MKVLIADFDLFNTIGGGQTFYRSIIEKNPEIEFYYLIRSEKSNNLRPANAQGILYQEQYFLRPLKAFCELEPPKWVHKAFIRASNIAFSIAGQSFDIIDLPDYEQFGIFIRAALRHHQVKFEHIALSMHGRISTTLQLNWEAGGKLDLSLDLLEQLQYRTVDIRYGISRSYLQEWSQESDLAAQYLHPLRFLSLPQPTLAESSAQERPDLNFVGRTEKRKGPDIFAELVWWLPRSSFHHARIIGGESHDSKGISSTQYMKQMLQQRSLDIELCPAMKPEQLKQLFASPSITLLPSRYDTLNLTALESLFSGCPTVVGSGAGVCQFLNETFPHVPYLLLDTHNIYGCLDELQGILKQYDLYRRKLVNSLKVIPAPSGLDLGQIYQSRPGSDPATCQQVDYWYNQLITFYATAPSKLTAAAIHLTKQQLKGKISSDWQRRLKNYRAQLNWQTFRNLLASSQFANEVRLLEQWSKLASLAKQYKRVLNLPETSEKDITQKLERCWELGSMFRVDRVRVWREIARLERIRGNDLVASTYQLRLMRLIGHDHFNELTFVKQTLNAQGFKREALAAEAMYGNHPDQLNLCRELLDEALVDHLFNPPRNYEWVDDRRDQSTYKVSIIVSLYNAAGKLPLFLLALKNQTLIQAGQVEIILIDSGSPGDEYAVFKDCLESLKLPIVYARSENRETIQSAWNRGISLSRAPYLTFLGVDETILPRCLEVLVYELETDELLDWVQGDSLVTNVDRYGTWVNDIMSYNRNNYHQDLVYLETCYLSWVGALYRKSIHDRFGYYDASFTAAGDTEFKNRVLPFIKTKHVPQTLGVFLNYPEERTTQHPRAEIEDTRAWYLHRTLAGVNYAMARRDPREAEGLLQKTLHYRKSYCQHWSTDLDYAQSVGQFLQARVPDAPALKYLDGITQLLAAYRSLDWLPKLASAPSKLLATYQLAANLESQHRHLMSQLEEQDIDLIYKIFNDNRYEQHSYLW